MAFPMMVGHGPIHVIALHGWFGSSSAWRPFAEVVDRQRFSYAFMDYRGYGEKRHVAGDYTMQEIAADTLALANELGWERFSLLGHSMGGKAIQHVLADAPQRIERLVAVTPVPASGVPFDTASWDLFASAAIRREARAAIIDASTGARLSKAWIEKMVEHSLAHSTPKAFASYLPAWAQGDFSAEVAGNPVPIQVIIGQHDAGLNEEVMRATYLRDYPNAQLEVLANAGHYPMDETPVALATAVERFLSQTI